MPKIVALLGRLHKQGNRRHFFGAKKHQDGKGIDQGDSRPDGFRILDFKPAPPRAVLDGNKDRYIDVTDQVRRMPVALVLVIDQMFIQDALAAYANSTLRFQVTQFHWTRFRGTLDGGAGAAGGAAPGFGPGGPGGPGGKGPPPRDKGGKGGSGEKGGNRPERPSIEKD